MLFAFSQGIVSHFIARILDFQSRIDWGKDGLFLGNWGKDAILSAPKLLFRVMFPQLNQ
jgi:hypothetical protein